MAQDAVSNAPIRNAELLLLPVTDRIRVCLAEAELRRSARIVPVLPVLADPSAIDPSQLAAAPEFLVRPFRAEELRLRLSRLLARSASPAASGPRYESGLDRTAEGARWPA